MITLDGVIALMHSHGLLLLVPLSVLEGPIVTVLAGYMASLDILNLAAAYVIVVLGDLVGDTLFYALGRHGLGRLPPRWRRRLGLNPDRIAALTDHFGAQGARTLVIGKLTHSAGAAILVAAGAARMPFAAFVWWNFLSTLPKSAVFLALGYLFGSAYAQIDLWIGRLSLVLLAGLAVGIAVWWRRRNGGTS